MFGMFRFQILYFFRKLLWCPVFKAASSAWMNVIPKLTNYKFSQIKLIRQRYVQANDVVRHILPPLSFTKLKLFLQNELPVKFLIVRHPFDRLLSAYRDKFEVFKVTKHYYQMVSRKKLKVKTKRFLNNVHQILFKENIAL